MGIKERRTKILLSLFLLTDTNFTPVNLDERAQKVFDLTFNQKTRGTLSGIMKEGLIEKSKIQNPKSEIEETATGGTDGRAPDDAQRSEHQREGNLEQDPSQLTNSYRLTEKGFSELCFQFPFFRFLKETWDGKWRVISYEIPEKKRELRDRLRREMQGWGLGPWHRSFWLTPHPILSALKSLTAQKEEEQYIQAFVGDHTFGDKELLIEKVWAKSVLDKRYRELFKKWHDILSGKEEKTDKFKKVVTEYVNILKEDPGLPKELVGEQWIGFEGFNIFKEIRSILLS